MSSKTNILFRIGDFVQHQNFIDLGRGKIIHISKFKKYTILFKTCFLKYCTEKYLRTANIVDKRSEKVLECQHYIQKTDNIEEESQFYENILDICSLHKIYINKDSEEYKYYSNLLGSQQDLESWILDIKNEIVMDMQDKIIQLKINPNILIHNKPIIQWFFEMDQFSIPLHIELRILRFLLEYSGGSDTIPSFKNGPSVFKSILQKFNGLGLSMALKILLDSGADVEKIVWEVMSASILPNTSFDKNFRNYIIDILCEYLTNKNECSICFENIGYKLSCCMRPGSTNYVCHECYINTTSCPFCRDTLGMLVDPEHERIINHIFTV